MWAILNAALVASVCCLANSSLEEQEPILYYYGIEESERGLRACAAQQACGVLLQRYWRAPAALRLCACPRRARCPAPLPAATVPLNNRAHFQFCEDVSAWELCSPGQVAVSVAPALPLTDPDGIEAAHHRGVALQPPAITFSCRCREPNYWRRLRDGAYTCEAPAPCRSGDRCGAVGGQLALHQACLCPRRHWCVHAGGRPRESVQELLDSGAGYAAYCQPALAGDAADDYD